MFKFEAALGLLLALMLFSCSHDRDSAFLAGRVEVQYEVNEEGHGPPVWFVFRQNGTWADYCGLRNDSLRPCMSNDVIHDQSFHFWGDSMYFRSQKWDVLSRDENSIGLKMRGTTRVWNLTRTDYPVARQ